jgi:hypothetical protein
VNEYTPAQLRELLELAQKLGFWDDALHWKRLLVEAERKERA